MNKEIIFDDWGIVEYAKAYKMQLEYFNQKIEKKLKNEENNNHIIFVEHPHVYTLGKSGNSENLMISESFLKEINAEYFRTDRGGDITYHGFGQIVIYPIIDLNNYNILIKKYINSIEEAIIRTVAEFGIKAERIEKAAGIWLLDRPKPEKICALGVRVSHGITMHGLAFNINTDLKYFDYINPCGFTDKGVTSLQKELGRKIDILEVKKILKEKFIEVFENIK